MHPLEVDSLVKDYKGQRALDGVSLTIREGEIFALLGPNGAGKTTLIGAVCGLVKKTSGRILLFGGDADTQGRTLRAQVGLVPQEINFDPFFTVRESLSLQLGYYGRPQDPARIDEVLAALKLTDKANAPTRALSGGMKRRVLIGKALVHRPKLVFLDEPTAGVDVELRRDLWDYVQRLKKEGTTVVLTTHYLEEAEALADRVGIIAKGKLVLVDDKQALIQRLGERALKVTFRAAAPSAPPVGQLSADRLSFTFVEKPGGPNCAEVLGQLYAQGLPIADVAMQPATLEDVMLRVLESAREGAEGQAR